MLIETSAYLPSAVERTQKKHPDLHQVLSHSLFCSCSYPASICYQLSYTSVSWWRGSERAAPSRAQEQQQRRGWWLRPLAPRSHGDHHGPLHAQQGTREACQGHPAWRMEPRGDRELCKQCKQRCCCCHCPEHDAHATPMHVGHAALPTPCHGLFTASLGRWPCLGCGCLSSTTRLPACCCCAAVAAHPPSVVLPYHRKSTLCVLWRLLSCLRRAWPRLVA